MHCDTHILSTYVNLKKTRHNHSFSIIAIQFCLQKHEFFYIGNTIHYLLLLVLNNRPCSNNGTQIHRPLFFLQNWVLTINILLMNHASLKTSRKSSKSNVNLSPKVKLRRKLRMNRLLLLYCCVCTTYLQDILNSNRKLKTICLKCMQTFTVCQMGATSDGSHLAVASASTLGSGCCSSKCSTTISFSTYEEVQRWSRKSLRGRRDGYGGGQRGVRGRNE